MYIHGGTRVCVNRKNGITYCFHFKRNIIYYYFRPLQPYILQQPATQFLFHY